MVHDHLIKYVKYLLGGMPATVLAFLKTNSFLKSKEMEAIILQTYQSDFGKYARKSEFKYLQILFDKVPNLMKRLKKKFALMSASPGKGDGVRGLVHLRSIIEASGGLVY